MDLTNIAPKASSDEFKHTKIVATVGPATNSYEAILELIKPALTPFDWTSVMVLMMNEIKQIEWVRQASKELSKPVALIQDLQGPKIRLGDLMCC